MKRILLPMAIAILVQGCATTPPPPYKLYEGETLQDTKIAKLIFDDARLTQPIFGYWEWVELRAADGHAIPQETRLRREYQLLPGTRQLTVRYKYDTSGAQGLLEGLLGEALIERMTRRFEKELTLEAKEGAEYVLKFQVKKDSALSPVMNWQVHYSIENPKTGEVVSSSQH